MDSTAIRLISGSMLRVITLIVNILVAFYMMPFLIHALGDRWYGMWTLIGSFMGYYGLLDLGLSSAVRRFIALARSRNDQKELNTILVTSLIILSAVGFASLLISIGIALAAHLFLSNPGEVLIFKIVVLILGINVALTFVFSVFDGVIEANLRYDLHCYIRITQLLARTGLMIYFIERGYSIVALAVIMLSVNVVGGAAIIAIAWRLCEGAKLQFIYFKRDCLRTLLSFGTYAFISRIAHIIRFSIDDVVVASFLNLSFVTHYNVAIRLIDYFRNLMGSALGIMTPVFTRYHETGDQKNMREKFLQATRFSVVMSTTVSGATLIFSKPFIRRWMGVDYLDAYWPLAILLTSMVFATMQIPSVNFLYAIAKHKFHALLNSAEAASNLGLSLILVQYYGMVGVALGTAIPLWITRLLILPRYVCRQIGCPVRAYYYQAGRLFLITAVGQLPLWYFVKALQISSYTSMLVLGIIFYPLYALILLRFVLPVTDRLLLAHKIPGLKWIV